MKKIIYGLYSIRCSLTLFSSTSVLMFMRILTSRYVEEDFLESLPRKMIIDLSTLFFSIAAMMTAFSAALFLLLHEQSWIFKLVIYLASIPSPSLYWCNSPFLLPWQFQLTDPASLIGKWSISFNIFIICVLLIWCTSVLLIIGIYQPNMKIFFSLFFFSIIQIMGHSLLFFVEMSLSLHWIIPTITRPNEMLRLKMVKNQLKHQESAAQSLLCKQKNLNPLASL